MREPQPANAATAAFELLELGTVLAERFEIERVVGIGGMGVVYLARDRALERAVAIKVHQGDWGGARLQREAIAMARLAHPNVITVFEVGRVGDHAFVAMEFIVGATLRAWANAQRRTLRDKLRVLADTGAGLAAAHAAGLVHRDFKPDNVLIGDDGRARVGDFGLARGSAEITNEQAAATPAPGEPPAPPAQPVSNTAPPFGGAAGRGQAPTVDLDAATLGMTLVDRPSRERRAVQRATTPPPAVSTPLTQTGAVLGTPAYMAPEQATGSTVNARADQFAFAVVAWELLFGVRPFAGATLVEIVTAVRRGQRVPPPRNARVSTALRRVLERGLSADPAARFPDVTALLAALKSAERAPLRRTAIAGGALVAIAFGLSLARSHASTAPALDCDHRANELVALVPTTLPAQLRALHTADGSDAADRIGAALTKLSNELRMASRQVCRGTADHSLSPALAERADACLQIEAMSAAQLTTLPTITGDEVSNLVVEAQALNEVEMCTDPGALLAGSPPPADPTTREAYETARAELDAADARVLGGSISSARTLVTSAEKSPAAAVPAIAARLALTRAEIANGADREAEAEREFEDAYYAGRAIDDVDVVLIAVGHLIQISSEFDNDPKKADTWIRAGIADAERARARTPRRAALVYISAAAANARGEHTEQAAAWCATGLELAGAMPSLGTIEGWGVAGEIACARGHYDECFADHAKAIGFARELLGSRHVRVAYLLENEALDYSDAGRGAQGLPLAREAETMLRGIGEAPSIDKLQAINTLDGMLLVWGTAADRRDARATLEHAHDQMIALVGADSPQLAVVESNLALAYNIDGDESPHADLERARTLLTHALALDEASVGPTDSTTADVLFNLGDTERMLHEFPAATAAATRSLAIRVATAPGSTLHAGALGLLAEIANDAGDPATAIDHARAALALPALRDSIAPRAHVELELARGLIATARDPIAATTAIGDARAIYTKLADPEGVSRCDAIAAELHH